ncbi:DUF924 family protein [Gilvimarinus xylanilyticus]|uniref:DUF924 domain-containing protein n=1 Tax=Gilvimarinus xylanilyticus TaxID=2944139 RepID=A0A9X2I697_9GAMM|nr:DUF924 domain-containing protein [Gilvimarinus xylanilyticus]
MASLDDVLIFWFEECSEKDWFRKSDRLDAEITQRFSALHAQIVAQPEPGQAAANETPESLLAKVILLDQLSRNMFRDTAQAFAHDGQALQLAQWAVDKKWDEALTPVQRRFLFMPYMHSESPQVHEKAVALFTQLGDKASLDFEYKHKAIVDRFGRYPHRNKILGRKSTGEERAFLTQPGSSF